MHSQRVLVDARAIYHGTAGGRGIGNYTAGLIRGLVDVGASVTALVSGRGEIALVESQIGRQVVSTWHPDVVRETSEAWYVATGMFLAPIAFDPIPRIITDAGLPVVGIMYDVIPFRHPELYFDNDAAIRQAAVRGHLARTVDITAAISQFSADTAIDHLGLDAASVTVIGAGVSPKFKKPPPDQHRFGVVAVTGPDPRKNTEGLIAAWALVRRELRVRHPLTVISGGPASLLDRWRHLAASAGCLREMNFAGSVSDQQMIVELQKAHLVVQPSLDEGFGLPVVEAAACGAAVICSDTSSLPEILREPSASFDPTHPADTAAAIERALTDPRHREVLLAAGERAVARWRWEAVAGALLDAMATHVPSRRPTSPPQRIAVIGTPPTVDEVTRALTQTSEVEVHAFVDSPSDAGHPEPCWNEVACSSVRSLRARSRLRPRGDAAERTVRRGRRPDRSRPSDARLAHWAHGARSVDHRWRTIHHCHRSIRRDAIAGVRRTTDDRAR